MKFFSLIYGDRVHAARKKGVIPAEEFSCLLRGKELVERISEEAERYRHEVVKESEELKEQSELAGYEEGLKRWAEQLAHFEKELQKAKEELEKLVVPVAINAAKKVVAHELQVNPETILDIVKQALRAVAQHHQFIIHVNKADFDALDANRQRLRDVLEHVESLSIRESDDVLPGDCIIETEAGIMNVQMEQVWNAIEAAFKSLLKS